MADNDALAGRLPTGSAPRAKSERRRELRARRRARREAGDLAAREREGQALLEHARILVAEAACVATFEPMPTEVNVEPLTAHILGHARVIVPITLDDLDLAWRDLATGADLGKEAIAEADIVLTPALAIGVLGERLGQGGGCYDRALPRRREGTPVIAVVFPDEVSRDFPTEAHDERVDGVLTPDGLTWFR